MDVSTAHSSGAGRALVAVLSSVASSVVPHAADSPSPPASGAVDPTRPSASRAATSLVASRSTTSRTMVSAASTVVEHRSASVGTWIGLVSVDTPSTGLGCSRTVDGLPTRSPSASRSVAHVSPTSWLGTEAVAGWLGSATSFAGASRKVAVSSPVGVGQDSALAGSSIAVVADRFAQTGAPVWAAALGRLSWFVRSTVIVPQVAPTSVQAAISAGLWA
mmetsp:Transcript_9234/g.22211  ORF Transcript_9234/g.22211 Transcript_9234/m.22211 type:complete len:219 (-) Transcript_9234:839-1495(-)